MTASERRKAQAVARAARLAVREDETGRQALADLWTETFEEGRLAALEELRDRVCVCMK